MIVDNYFSSDYEVQDGVLPERLVPTRVEKYPTKVKQEIKIILLSIKIVPGFQQTF